MSRAMDSIHEESYEDQVRLRAKRELRKRMRALRATLPPNAVAERSAALVARVLAHEAWAPARAIALFHSMPDEVQTGALIEAARKKGKRVALPVVTEEQALTFRAPYEVPGEPPLSLSAFGILEPTEAAPLVDPATLDLVVVPALAFDPRGHRIGYGRGYYDRTLPLASSATHVGVAFDFQLIAEVPERAGDVPVHWIITDRRVLRAES